MLFTIIIIIYVLLLIIIETLFIYFNHEKKDMYISFKNVDSSVNKLELNENFIYNESDEDINLDNYMGKFLISNYYGFFINNDKWYILEENKEYNFKFPVNIKIIKFNNDKKIIYYSDSKINKK